MLVGKPDHLARVDTVQPDSAAAKAGIQPGDFVVSINGRPIESFTEMQRMVEPTLGSRSRSPSTARSRAAVLRAEADAQRGICDGVLGISRSVFRDDLKVQKAPPGMPSRSGVTETYVRGRTFTSTSAACSWVGSRLTRWAARRDRAVSGQAWKSGFDNGGTGGAFASLL